jgi:hypothetical protein
MTRSFTAKGNPVHSISFCLVLSATKPQVKPGSSGIKHDFKMTPDGRLIITGNQEEEKPKPSKEAEMEDLEDLLDAFEGPTKVRSLLLKPIAFLVIFATL